MNYLLDTHYILWTLFTPERINAHIIKILEDDKSSKFISGINLWEISWNYSLGKLELENTSPEDIFETLIKSGFEILEVDSLLFASYHKLPKKENHRDPFDRMLIWQAINNEYTLISNDEKFKNYIVDGLKLQY